MQSSVWGHTRIYFGATPISNIYERSTRLYLMFDCRLFADDTNLTYADKDYKQVFSAMNSDLNILKSWLDAKQLSLNALKTKCMFISTRHKLATIPDQPEISANGHHIK